MSVSSNARLTASMMAAGRCPRLKTLPASQQSIHDRLPSQAQTRTPSRWPGTCQPVGGDFLWRSELFQKFLVWACRDHALNSSLKLLRLGVELGPALVRAEVECLAFAVD